MSADADLLLVEHLEGPDGSTATVRSQGATLTSWKTADGKERVFVSSKAKYQAGAAIRGGVPVCWPQFGMRGPLAQQHGFARNSTWRLGHKDKSSISFVLDEKIARVPADWTASFELELRVRLGAGTLHQELVVRNSSPTQPLVFTTALHTYLTVPDLASACVTGLEGLQYQDNTRPGTTLKQETPEVGFPGEIDRLYAAVPGPVELVGARGAGGTRVDKQNFPDVVVWNPAAAKAATMADLSGWEGFVCIEVAHAAGEPVSLVPGAEWIGSQTLSPLAS